MHYNIELIVENMECSWLLKTYDELDKIFTPRSKWYKETMYEVLRYYIMLNELKIVVHWSGLVLFDCGCNSTCGSIGCGSITMGQRKVLPLVLD